MSYRHIFFDLDHTLWDFERNSEETIYELFEELRLASRIRSPKLVYTSFSKVNRFLWNEYHSDRISKEELRRRRFEMVLEQNGVRDESLAEKLSNMYIEICPHKPHLLPNALETLDYLHKKYTLHLISNGFQEVTELKLLGSSLQHFFKTVCTPSSCGHKKPEKEIFLYALNQAKANVQESIMIGDDLEADILGAKECGMHQIYFNPLCNTHSYQFTFEIKDMIELKKIL